MKPIFKALLLCSIIVTVISCSKDNKEEINTDDKDSYVLVHGKTFDLSGVWKMSSRLPYPDSAWIPVPYGDSTFYTFTKDGKYTMERPNNIGSGTYTLKSVQDQDIDFGVKLTLYDQGEAVTEWRLDVKNDGSLRMDRWATWDGTGYASILYNKLN
jgi:hypothetical protein